jgi:hypothetical protein
MNGQLMELFLCLSGIVFLLVSIRIRNTSCREFLKRRTARGDLEISSWGRGRVRQGTDGNLILEDFELVTFDLVDDPVNPDC